MLGLGLGLLACGGSGQGASAERAPSAVAGRTQVTAYFPGDKNDRDNDGDHNDDDAHLLYFGRAADTAERNASMALVTHYFAAAAAEDGPRACSLLVPFIAESVVENYGHTPALRGTTCAAVMSKLFKQHHALLATKSSALKVAAVRVEGDKALVILEFPTISEVRQLTERRQGSAWKVQTLLDGILE
jgi:hypothetical protein